MARTVREALLLLLVVYPAASQAALRPETVEAWDDYTRAAELRVRESLDRRVLWLDREPGRRDRVKRGEIPAGPAAGKSPSPVPQGLIHDWTGAVFIPGAMLTQVLALVHDYGRYAEFYGPSVRASQTLSHEGDRASFRVRYLRKALFATVVFDADYDVRYFPVDDLHFISVARSTSVREIQNHDEPGERSLPADDGSGYVWRTCSLLTFAEEDGGVYVEQESIALSRRIPGAWKWLVEPFVDRLARGLVTGWLEQTRTAVLGGHAAAGMLLPGGPARREVQ